MQNYAEGLDMRRLLAVAALAIVCTSDWSYTGAAEPSKRSSGGTDDPRWSVQQLEAQVLVNCMRLASLKSDNIRSDNEKRNMAVDLRDIEAVDFLKACRSSQAVNSLLPFIGVEFMAADPRLGPKSLRVELAANNALREIGLPGVDAILRAIAKSKLKPWQITPARDISVAILGEKGVRVRAEFLGLADNAMVNEFIKGKDQRANDNQAVAPEKPVQR